MDNSKSMKDKNNKKGKLHTGSVRIWYFNKMFLKLTAIVVIGAFLFNTVFVDLAWAYSSRSRPVASSFLRQSSLGANKHIQREITGAIIRGLDKEELKKFIEKNGGNVDRAALEEEFKIIISMLSDEEILKKQRALFDLADKLELDREEMLNRISQARNDLLEENRKVLKHFPDIVRNSNKYGLGLGTEKYLGYGREILAELQGKCNLRAELLYHEAVCYRCEELLEELKKKDFRRYEKLKEKEGHQIARQIQMIFFPQNYGVIAGKGDSRPELTGKLTWTLREFINDKTQSYSIPKVGHDNFRLPQVKNIVINEQWADSSVREKKKEFLTALGVKDPKRGIWPSFLDEHSLDELQNPKIKEEIAEIVEKIKVLQMLGIEDPEGEIYWGHFIEKYSLDELRSSRVTNEVIKVINEVGLKVNLYGWSAFERDILLVGSRTLKKLNNNNLKLITDEEKFKLIGLTNIVRAKAKITGAIINSNEELDEIQRRLVKLPGTDLVINEQWANYDKENLMPKHPTFLSQTGKSLFAIALFPLAIIANIFGGLAIDLADNSAKDLNLAKQMDFLQKIDVSKLLSDPAFFPTTSAANVQLGEEIIADKDKDLEDIVIWGTNNQFDGDINCANYDYVTFRIDAAEGGEKIGIQMLDKNTTAGMKRGLSQIYVLPRGIHELHIPLSEFKGQDLSSLRQINIECGEEYFGEPLNSKPIEIDVVKATFSIKSRVIDEDLEEFFVWEMTRWHEGENNSQSMLIDEHINCTGYKYLILNIWSHRDDGKIVVQLLDKNTTFGMKRGLSQNYTLSKGWQEVKIPLSQFEGQDLSSIWRINVEYGENCFGEPLNADRLRISDSIGVTFSKKFDWRETVVSKIKEIKDWFSNLLVVTSAQKEISGEESIIDGSRMQYYSGAGWASMAVNQQIDCSECESLKIKAKGKKDGEKIIVQLLDKDTGAGQERGLSSVYTLSKGWQEIETPLSEFSGQDLNTIWQVAIHYGETAWGKSLNPSTAQIEVENIKFTGKEIIPVITPSPTPERITSTPAPAITPAPTPEEIVATPAPVITPVTTPIAELTPQPTPTATDSPQPGIEKGPTIADRIASFFRGIIEFLFPSEEPAPVITPAPTPSDETTAPTVVTPDEPIQIDVLTPTEQLQIEQQLRWLRENTAPQTGLPISHVGEPLIGHWGFTYDASIVAQAYLVTGMTEDAKGIIDYYITHKDIWSKGGLINAVDVTSTWEDGRGTEWVVHTGPNVHLGIGSYQISSNKTAIGAYQVYQTTGEVKYLDFAKDRADFAILLQNRNSQDINYGGIRMGPKGEPSSPADQRLGWDPNAPSWYEIYSDEHNEDAWALFNMIYQATGEVKYKEARDLVLKWLKDVGYNKEEHRFNRGYKERGYKDEPAGIDTVFAPDTQFWGVSVFGVELLDTFNRDRKPTDLHEAELIMQTAEERALVTKIYTKPDGSQVSITGFDFIDHETAKKLGRQPDISPEWTYQAANAYLRIANDLTNLGEKDKANIYLQKRANLLENMRKLGTVIDGNKLAFPYSTLPNSPTGHGWNTPAKGTFSSIGNAYGILAVLGYDPLIPGGGEGVKKFELGPEGKDIPDVITERVVKPETAVKTTTQDYIGTAWGAWNIRDWQKATGEMESMIKQHPDWLEIAKRQNEELERKGGYISYNGENAQVIFDSWAVNDIGTGYFILVRGYDELGEHEKAMAAAVEILTNYNNAQCWDPKGWFWQPIISLQNEHPQIYQEAKAKIESGDKSSYAMLSLMPVTQAAEEDLVINSGMQYGSGERWASRWVNQQINCSGYEKLKIKVWGHKGDKIVVQLLDKDTGAGQERGLSSVYILSKDRQVIEIPLSEFRGQDLSSIWRVAIHSGEEYWGKPLNPSGEAVISVEEIKFSKDKPFSIPGFGILEGLLIITGLTAMINLSKRKLAFRKRIADFKSSIKALKGTEEAKQEYDNILTALRKAVAAQEFPVAKTIILYSEWLLENGAVIDLEESLKLLLNNDILDKIVLYAEEPAYNQILGEVIEKVGAKKIILKTRKNLPDDISNEVEEIKELIKSAELETKNILCVIKGTTEEQAELKKLSDKKDIPPIVVFDGKGPYSIAEAINRLIADREMFINLPPIDASQDVQEKFQEYQKSLHLLTKA